MLVNAANVQSLFVDYNLEFNLAWAAAAAQSTWERIAQRVQISTQNGHYPFLDSFPELRDWIGDRQVKNFAAHAYTIENVEKESTVEVKVRDIEGDQHGIYSTRIAHMARAAATHPDKKCYALLTDGFAAECYDGQFFFDTDHEEQGASVSNMQAGAAAPWFLLCTSMPLKPLIRQVWKEPRNLEMTGETDESRWKRNAYQFGIEADDGYGYGFWQMAFGSQDTLNESNFNAAFEAIMERKDDEGASLGLMPDLLVCGPSNRANANAVLLAERNASGASNTNFKATDLIVSPYLT